MVKEINVDTKCTKGNFLISGVTKRILKDVKLRLIEKSEMQLLINQKEAKNGKKRKNNQNGQIKN